MAFYPDELSPIELNNNFGKLCDSSDLLNALKNRKQRKSGFIGKKDMAMSSFATITEEKEEEISNDGSINERNKNNTFEIFPF